MKPTTKLTKAMHLLTEIYFQITAETCGSLRKLKLAEERLAKADKYLLMVKQMLKAKK